jgi:hypothetical protein
MRTDVLRFTLNGSAPFSSTCLKEIRSAVHRLNCDRAWYDFVTSGHLVFAEFAEDLMKDD